MKSQAACPSASGSTYPGWGNHDDYHIIIIIMISMMMKMLNFTKMAHSDFSYHKVVHDILISLAWFQIYV